MYLLPLILILSSCSMIPIPPTWRQEPPFPDDRMPEYDHWEMQPLQLVEGRDVDTMCLRKRI